MNFEGICCLHPDSEHCLSLNTRNPPPIFNSNKFLNEIGWFDIIQVKQFCGDSRSSTLSNKIVEGRNPPEDSRPHLRILRQWRKLSRCADSEAACTESPILRFDAEDDRVFF